MEPETEDGTEIVVVEEGEIDDIPLPDEIVEELSSDRSSKPVPLPKGFIVGPMEGITVETEADTG